MEAEKKITEAPPVVATTTATPTEPEAKPFPETPDWVPEDQKESYRAFLKEEAKKVEETTKKIKSYASIAAKRKGVEAFNMFGLDNSAITDSRVSELRSTVLNMMEGCIADTEERLTKKPATATPSTPNNNNNKQVTITETPKGAQQQQQAPPAKNPIVDQVFDVLYSMEYKKNNKG